MRKFTIYTTIILLVSLITIVSAEGFSDIVKYFKAESKTDKVVIKWFSLIEKDIKEFVVQRSMDGQNYADLKKLNPSGENKEYNYIDDTLFKSSSRIYYYRLKVTLTDGSSVHSETIKIIPKISGIRQTCGTIKAIFQ